jgi:hypothetical protein
MREPRYGEVFRDPRDGEIVMFIRRTHRMDRCLPLVSSRSVMTRGWREGEVWRDVSDWERMIER